MSSADLSKFLKALAAVKQDYTCGVCSQLCKNPITLSKCFHIICSEHFEGLETCPECGVTLDGCRTYSDERLGPTIESFKALDQMFDKYKGVQTDNKTVVKRAKHTAGKSSDNAEAVEDLSPKQPITRSKQKNLHITPKEDDSSKEKKKNVVAKSSKPMTRRNSTKCDNLNITPKEDDSSKENKKQNVVAKSASKPTTRRNSTFCDNLNVSMKSTASSKTSKEIEKRNHKGETMLHIACRLGLVDKITDLLQKGANTNTKDNAGWTPLHEVVQNGRLDLVKLLLQFNTLINIPGLGNETPLHEAVRYNHKDIAEELVMNGADVNAKNCKGETPMKLATGEMESVLKLAAANIIQTQSVNITRISSLYLELDFDDIRVFCVSEFRTVHNKLKTLAKHHGNVHIEQKFTKKVTHLIVDTDDDGICQSSSDVLQGIVSSIWILTTNWIMKSTDEKLEPFNNYEVIGVGAKTYNGPKNARYNKYKQFPGIFDGCHFYLHNFNVTFEISETIVLTKAILSKLITDAGGVVLRRVPNPESIPDSENLVPYHARKDGKLVNCSHYIIFKDTYQPLYNMKHLKALPVGWLIECIEKYELCEPW